MKYLVLFNKFLILCSTSVFPFFGSRYDRMLSEMVGHLERQPLNREPRLAWLTLVGPVFDAMGLFLLAHLRRVFSLFFQWMHVDDDKTVLLVRSMYRLCM
jgi:hypothetical protein